MRRFVLAVACVAVVIGLGGASVQAQQAGFNVQGDAGADPSSHLPRFWSMVVHNANPALLLVANTANSKLKVLPPPSTRAAEYQVGPRIVDTILLQPPAGPVSVTMVYTEYRRDTQSPVLAPFYLSFSDGTWVAPEYVDYNIGSNAVIRYWFVIGQPLLPAGDPSGLIYWPYTGSWITTRIRLEDKD